MKRRSPSFVAQGLRALSAVMPACMAAGAHAGGPIQIPPADDHWRTPVVTVQFGSGDIRPIPADFFFPGSDPFVGAASFTGVMDNPNLGNFDTVVRRMGTADLPFNGAQDTVPIQLLELNLVSVNPITVTSNGGQNPEPWHMFMDILAPASGTATITRTHAQGGTVVYQYDALDRRIRFLREDAPGQGIMHLFGPAITQPAPWTTIPPSVRPPGSGPNFYLAPGFTGTLLANGNAYVHRFRQADGLPTPFDFRIAGCTVQPIGQNMLDIAVELDVDAPGSLYATLFPVQMRVTFNGVPVEADHIVEVMSAWNLNPCRPETPGHICNEPAGGPCGRTGYIFKDGVFRVIPWNCLHNGVTHNCDCVKPGAPVAHKIVAAPAKPGVFQITLDPLNQFQEFDEQNNACQASFGQPIPAVGEWGLHILAAVVVTMGVIVILRRV